MALNLQQAINQAFGASGTNHSGGLVPDPGSVSGTGRFLREDATWQTPSGFSGLNTNGVIYATSGTTILSTAAGSSGIPLIGGTPPSFGTATVPGGGTGDTSFTAYAVICGGTTTTGALQSIAGLGSSGNVLTSNGAAALPTFQAPSGGSGSLVSFVTYSSTQTITIPATATKAFIRMWGGTGGSGGIAAGATGATGGSGAAGYLEKYLTSLTGGNTVAYTQGGAGGAGASAGGGTGGNGGASSLASGTQTITTLTANGSNGTLGVAVSGSTVGTAGGTATNGDVNITGASGSDGILADQNAVAFAMAAGGAPGGSLFAPGAKGINAAAAGNAGHSGGLVIAWFT